MAASATLAEWLSGRVAEWLSGCSIAIHPLRHSARVAEWLSGCFDFASRVANRLYNNTSYSI